MTAVAATMLVSDDVIMTVLINKQNVIRKRRILTEILRVEEERGAEMSTNRLLPQIDTTGSADNTCGSGRRRSDCAH